MRASDEMAERERLRAHRAAEERERMEARELFFFGVGLKLIRSPQTMRTQPGQVSQARMV